MRGASLEERCEITIEVDALDERPNETQGSAVANEVGHDCDVIGGGEFISMPEARKWPGHLLVLERPRRIELCDLRCQSLTDAEMRRLPGDYIAWSEKIGGNARDHTLAGLLSR